MSEVIGLHLGKPAFISITANVKVIMFFSVAENSEVKEKRYIKIFNIETLNELLIKVL